MSNLYRTKDGVEYRILDEPVVEDSQPSASPVCYGVWYETKNNPPPFGVWCVGRKGKHRPFTFRAMEEGKIFNSTAYIDADNSYRDPDCWQAIAP